MSAILDVWLAQQLFKRRLRCFFVDFAVLVGGAGKRLGMEKAALSFGGVTLLEKVINRLGVADVIIVKKSKARIPAINGIRVVKDPDERIGALIGLRTALLASKTEYCFVFACDMPFISGNLVNHMLSLAGECDAFVPYYARGIEPLHAIYSKRCLKTMEWCIENGDMSVHSMLKHTNVRFAQADLFCDPYIAFTNINTTGDYERARRILSSVKEEQRYAAHKSCQNVDLTSGYIGNV
jgi:molybdopterin-guanine dinucleotide biosynthesis protein A